MNSTLGSVVPLAMFVISTLENKAGWLTDKVQLIQKFIGNNESKVPKYVPFCFFEYSKNAHALIQKFNGE